MLKKILIGIAVLIIMLGAAFLYLNHRNRTLSPPGQANMANGDLMVAVSYSRPSVRERVIFADNEEAVVPFGKYWRLGANEATEISFNRDVIFNDQKVKKGTYRMYAVPGSGEFQINLNSELGRWGYIEPDYSKDVAKTTVPVTRLSRPVEQFTISLENTTEGIDAVFEWADVRFVVPIKKAAH